MDKLCPCFLQKWKPDSVRPVLGVNGSIFYSGDKIVDNHRDFLAALEKGVCKNALFDMSMFIVFFHSNDIREETGKTNINHGARNLCAFVVAHQNFIYLVIFSLELSVREANITVIIGEHGHFGHSHPLNLIF
jgi:hypothetical protein